MNVARDGWELTKENIQPLSSGRRMAHLEESMPVTSATGLDDHLQYESHHLQEIKKLEEIAKQSLGDDPLQKWMDAINYLQQHFPNMTPSITAKFATMVKAAVGQYFYDRNYRNDRRFINLLLISVKTLSIQKQIAFLAGVLNDGTGELISDLYIKLAELYEIEEDTKKASEILKTGISKVTEEDGRSRLEEMLSHVQQAWAEKYAKAIQNNEVFGNEDHHSNKRSFASCVPIMGEKNEAISIRQNLQPAAPMNTTKSTLPSKQNKLAQNLPIFNEENAPPRNAASNDDNLFRRFQQQNGLASLERADNDRENQLDACRWNSADTHLDNPVIPEPPAKMKLYEESDISASSVKKLHVDKRVLKERKEEPEPTVLDATSFQSQSESTNIVDESSISTKAKETTSEIFISKDISSKDILSKRRNNHPNKGKDNFFENIKYKVLPSGRVANRLMVNVDRWLEKKEKERRVKELENNEVTQLRKKVELLEKSNKELNEQVKFVRILEDKVQELQRISDEIVQKDEKILSLEAENDDLMSQLTRASTCSNVKESNFHREKMQLENQLEHLRMIIEKERQEHGEEIQEYKNRLDELIREKSVELRVKTRQEIVDNENQSMFGMKQSVIDVDVRSVRTTDAYSPSSTDQGSSESSRFHSGDTTKVGNENQSIAASSFMPELGMDNEKSLSMEPAHLPRRALGMVDRPLESDMMNMTPVTAPPMDFELPRAPSFGGSLYKRPLLRTFSLYESMSDSMCAQPARGNSSMGVSKRPDVMKNIQILPENLPPPPGSQEPQAIPTSDSEHFLRPTVSSDENALSNHFVRNSVPDDPIATLPKPRRSIILGRYQEHSSDEEDDEIILRRHQQTGIDLNVSNLTTALMLGPKPLTNSTPEKEKTLRTISGLVGRNFATQDTEDTPVSDSQGTRQSRYSILNEPPLNLSTIQETSRENRSRSTTGSSSGNTMSATRIGMATSSTQLYGSNTMARSSSIPRSASRISQQNNNNGYYSDTNAML